uniref:CLIP domain-containing serine protease n=1 Tax=Culex pipiens TaxID=7175 RepID=A0A8D8HYW6_CULPI
MLSKVVAALVALLIAVTDGQVVLPPAVEGGTCQTGSELGQCVPFREYPRYVQLLRNTQRSEQETNFLRSSVCGRSQSGSVLVCRPVRLNDPECGQGIRDRIVKGKIAELEDYPWMALFQYRKPRGNTGFHCGGVLITRRYVLSAAHCFVGLRTGWEPIMVRLGEWDFESEMDCSQGNAGEELHCAPPVQDFLLERIIAHEEFNVKDANRANDVALVRMSGEAVFSNYVKPICLPEVGAVDSERLYDGILVASGWGKTENASASRYKLYTELAVSDYEICKSDYVREQKVQLGAGQLCAGGEDGRDTCNGDSGGPLMKEVAEQGRFYVAGLVSFGPNKCGEQLPGVYTRVEHYLQWIVAKVLESSRME